MKSKKQDIQKFLKEIGKDEKIAIIIHDDLDGIASGVLMKDFLMRRGCGKIEIGIFSYGKENQNIKDLIDSSDKIIFMDVSPSGINIFSEKIADKKAISIDHHKREELPENIIDYYPKNYIPASRLVFELLKEIDNETEKKEWLALAGVMSDAGERYPENIDFIYYCLDRVGISLNDFKEKIVYRMIDTIIYFDENLKKAFETIDSVDNLGKVEKLDKYYDKVEGEIQREIKNAEKNWEKFGKIIFYYFKPKFAIKSVVINNLCSRYLENIFVFACPDKEIINISARNQSKQYDVADLLKKTISGLENAGAGGHFAAAGGFIMKKDFERFKKRVKEIAI